MKKSKPDLKGKILLSLLHGVAFGFAYTPAKQHMVLKSLAEVWDSAPSQVSKEVRNLKRAKLIEKISKEGENLYNIELTEKGKLAALEYFLIKQLRIKNKKWDGKWRILIFDVPENFRKGRDALRWKIKKLGFYELQKSVFVIPYECKKEIDLVVDYFGLKAYVHYGILEIVDEKTNQKLRKAFGLAT